MKKEIEINERIEAFLNGDLTLQEATAFEEQMKADPLLAAEVKRHDEVRRIITDGAYLQVKNDLREIHIKSLRHRRINRIKGVGFGGLLVLTALIILIKTGNDKIVLPELVDSAGTHNSEHDSAKKVFYKVIKEDMDFSHLSSGSNETPSEQNISQPVTFENIADSVDLYLNQPYDLLDANELILPDPIDIMNDETAIPAENCKAVHIKGSFTSEESCNNSPTGSIEIHAATISGGNAPYVFSIDNISFRDTAIFKTLYPGSYSLYVKDANNCIDLLGTAFVTSYDCSYQAAFAPGRGETWRVPLKAGLPGALGIFTKSGTLVYSLRFSNDETLNWDGSSTSGQSLPMGAYQFHITYSDGSSFRGNVTIIR